MNVKCPNCATVFRVDPAKVPVHGVRARCSVCAAVFPVKREEAATASAPAAPAPAAAQPTVSRPTPPPAPPIAAQPPAPSAPPAMPAAPMVPPTPRPQPAAASMAPPAIPGARPPQPRPGTTPLPTPAPMAPPRPAAGGRSVNPFLSQDPSQKARRLARALVSDMVVYHPAKRRDALKAGTIKESFKEEISKSWEEYVEQVGKDLAESTPYFKEALNEILGDGKPIF